MRRFLLPLAACLALAAMPSGAASLRGEQVHVAADVVTLADLFDGAGGAGTAEVAKAPPPGKTIMIDSGALYALAVANHLDWRPLGRNQKVIVLRDGDSLTGVAAATAKFDPDTVIAPLKPALTAQGAGTRLAVLLDGGAQMRLLSTIPPGTALAVDALQFAKADKKFSATLVDAATGNRYAVTGRALALIDVPVPTRLIALGETITAADLTTTEQREDQLRSDTAERPEMVVGKVAKEQLNANQPIQRRFLALPVVIRRDDRVTMMVLNDGIVITAEGRALNDAGLGETVRLANSATNKTLEGTVTGPNTAEVHTDTSIIAAAAAPAATIVR